MNSLPIRNQFRLYKLYKILIDEFVLNTYCFEWVHICLLFARTTIKKEWKCIAINMLLFIKPFNTQKLFLLLNNHLLQVFFSFSLISVNFCFLKWNKNQIRLINMLVLSILQECFLCSLSSLAYLFRSPILQKICSFWSCYPQSANVKRRRKKKRIE